MGKKVKKLHRRKSRPKHVGRIAVVTAMFTLLNTLIIHFSGVLGRVVEFSHGTNMI